MNKSHDIFPLTQRCAKALVPLLCAVTMTACGDKRQPPGTPSTGIPMASAPTPAPAPPASPADSKAPDPGAPWQWTRWSEGYESWVQTDTVAVGETGAWSATWTSPTEGRPMKATRMTVTRVCDDEVAPVLRLRPSRLGYFRWQTKLSRASVCKLRLRAFTVSGSIEAVVEFQPGAKPPASPPGIVMPKLEQWRHQVRSEPVKVRLTRPFYETEATLESADLRRLKVPASGTLARVDGRPWPTPDLQRQRGEPLMRLALKESILVTEVRPPWHPPRGAKRHDEVHVLELRAPTEGVITRVRAHPGQQVAADAPLIDFAGQTELICRVQLATHEMATLERPTIVLQPSPEQTEVFSARVRVDRERAALSVPIDNRAGHWRVGQTLPAVVEYGAGEERPVVPNSAVIPAGSQRLCFVQIDALRFEQRDVQIARRSVDTTEITSGLKAGDRVVISGAAAVRAAMHGSNGAD